MASGILKSRDTAGALKPYLDYFIGGGRVEPKLKLKIRPIEGVTARRLLLGEDRSSSHHRAVYLLEYDDAGPAAVAGESWKDWAHTPSSNLTDSLSEYLTARTAPRSTWPDD